MTGLWISQNLKKRQ